MPISKVPELHISSLSLVKRKSILAPTCNIFIILLGNCDFPFFSHFLSYAFLKNISEFDPIHQKFVSQVLP